MNYHELLTVISLFFLLISFFSLTSYRKKYQKIKKNFDSLSIEKTTLAEECSRLHEQIAEQVSFSRDLSNAELTTKLQHSRINYQSDVSASVPPERYNYIRALSDSGIEPKKIAELLSISHHEAEQLVKLTKIGSK